MRGIRSAAAAGILGLGLALAHAAPPAPQFNREIKPILAEHCFHCHGQDANSRKAGLRLDIRESALAPAKSGRTAIVPGRPEASELLARLTTHDPDDLMPPPEEQKPLSASQVESLKAWIAAGAEYQPHWAFIPPASPAIPELPKSSQALNPIDAFVLERLAREGLSPAPAAPLETLIRRAALDITGIPPSPAEIDAFLADHAARGEAAYADWVDTLLKSPRYAEKWTRWWLDAARYADSDGYEKDLPREQWTWRDWVLDAMARDLPYDQFLVEQIAGDLLPGATQAQRVATGYLRNGMVNEEGAVIAEQFRLEGMFDRMDAIGKGVLGLTLQCAQCHTHKYDPLTHEEYYRLFSFINNTHETTSWVYSPEQLQAIESIRRAAEANEAAAKALLPDWKERMAAWEEGLKPKKVEWTPVDAIENEWVGGLAHPEKQPDKSILTLGFRPTTGELWFTTITREPNITGLRLEALTHGDLPYSGPGRGYKGTFAISEFTMEAAPLPVVGANTNHAAEIKSGFVPVGLAKAVADIEGPDEPIDPKLRRANDNRRTGPAAYLVDGKEETAWNSDLGPGRRNHDSRAVIQIATNGWASADGTFLRFWIKYRHGGEDGHGRQNNFLGRFRLSTTTDPDPLADPLPVAARAALETPPGQRGEAERQLLFAEWRKSEPELAGLNQQIDALWKNYPEGESVLNLSARDPEWSRPTPIYERGDWQKPSRNVPPGVPAFLHPMEDRGGPPRLEFAKWLVDRRSPTTARAAVNRVWQAIFGQGLVESPEDLGVRSPNPTHPELLDWLSVAFMEGQAGSAAPWSIRGLVRTIVMSATYRQDSRADAAMLERDPSNKLLARGPRFRAEAEVVRDIALTSSGLLHERVGGRSFYPPVPESLFALNFVKIDWPAAPAPERHRRSLYMFRRRSMPDPVMASFDAPNADFACVRRQRSNTPMAALAFLNETVFVEAAQALALRTLREGGATDESRADHAFRLCAGRTPSDLERAAILELLHSQGQRIADGWLPARELSTGGDTLPAIPPGTNPRQLAAWTIVSRVLLNLDETLTKN